MSVWTYKSCFLVTKNLLKVSSNINTTLLDAVLVSVSILWTRSGNTLRTLAGVSYAINRFSSIYEKFSWLQPDSNPQPLSLQMNIPPNLFTNQVVVGSNPATVNQTSDIASVSCKEFFDIQATIECKATLKCVRDLIKMHTIHEKFFLKIYLLN